MAIKTSINIPTSRGAITLELKSGASTVFIGANGAGKTRLGVFIDRALSAAHNIEVHRIAAHRSLVLNPNIIAPNLEVAEKRLFFGRDNAEAPQKEVLRWGQKPETALLSDFDHVLAALYAENNDVSVAYRPSKITYPKQDTKPPDAKIDKLKYIWESLLPHRKLDVLASNVKTKTVDENSTEYSASDMSDGERVIFYLIGQSLLAKNHTILIFDEPELHINRSILPRLWDEIESARKDCAFIYITHDVEFASSRHAASKFALRSYQKVPKEAWDIEPVPEEADIPDDVVATIIGSRRSVVFVEGTGGSLDYSLYRRVYNDFTIIPVGSCEQVIHTVASFGSRPELHRVRCAGLIDADGRAEDETARLQERGIYCLPVSEVENLLLLPDVFLAIARELKFDEFAAAAKLSALRTIVFGQASQQINQICLRYTRRRIDAEMKKIGLSGTDVDTLDSEFKAAASGIDARIIFDRTKADLSTAIFDQNYAKVLLYYDNKGLLADAAKLLGYQQKALEEFVGRALRSDESTGIHKALVESLPVLTPCG